MTSYKLEIKKESDGTWDDVITFKPEYVWEIKSRCTFLWFGCHEYAVIDNLREAEHETEEKAMAYAKAMYKATPCRLMKNSNVQGIRSSDVIWQNGCDLESKSWWSRWFHA